MKVVMPVAGSGTRLRPHTFSQPKALLPVADKTILDYVIKPLLHLDVEEIVFVIGHLGDQIRDHVRRHYRFRSIFVEQDRLMGLGYAIRQGLEQIDDGPVLILLGDTIVDDDLAEMIAGDCHALALHRVDDPHRFGIATVEDGWVSDVVEKPVNPPSRLALIGLYYLKDMVSLRRELDHLIDGQITTYGEIQLTDALKRMIAAGERFRAFGIDHWYDCGKQETVLASNAHLLSKLPAPTPRPGCELIAPTYVAASAKIEDSRLGPNVAVSEEARIKSCRLTNCIVSSEAYIRNCELRDSIIGPQTVISGVRGVVNVGQGTEVQHG